MKTVIEGESCRLPGTVTVGDWAHMRWGGHHLVKSVEGDEVRAACGKRFERWRVFHDVPLPHMPRCKGCERAS